MKSLLMKKSKFQEIKSLLGRQTDRHTSINELFQRCSELMRLFTGEGGEKGWGMDEDMIRKEKGEGLIEQKEGRRRWERWMRSIYP